MIAVFQTEPDYTPAQMAAVWNLAIAVQESYEPFNPEVDERVPPEELFERTKREQTLMQL